MAFSQTDLSNIESALASGVMKAVIDGKEVQYQKASDMLLVRDTIRADLASQQATRRSYPRNQVADFSDNFTDTNQTGYYRFAR